MLVFGGVYHHIIRIYHLLHQTVRAFHLDPMPALLHPSKTCLRLESDLHGIWQQLLHDGR